MMAKKSSPAGNAAVSAGGAAQPPR
jgi:hypothetical protein